MAGSIPASPTASIGSAPARHRGVTPWGEAWRRFRRHRLALVSVVVLASMVVLGAFGPWIWQVPINEIDFSARLANPTLRHPFGTDDLGQDLFARMLYGGPHPPFRG